MAAAQSKADLAREVEEAVEEERAKFGLRDEPSSAQILAALATEEAGDADLFAYLFRGRRCYDQGSGKWFSWAGHYWAECPENDALDCMASVADAYLAQARREDDAADAAIKDRDDDEQARHEKLRDALRRRAKDLGKAHRMKSALFLSQSSKRLGVRGDVWDARPRLLPCENGTLELLQEEPYLYFRDGRPDDYCRAVAPARWAGVEAAAPRFAQFLAEVFGEDREGDAREISEFLARLVGYIVAGDPVEHIFPIFYGAGRNGKSTLMELLREVFGPALVGPCDTETILRGQDRRAGGASPDLAALRGLRLAIARESKEGRRLDEATVKALTGGDTIVARPMYEAPISFRPSFTLVQLTNHKPQIDAEDAAIWMRVVLLPFLQTFVTNPDDLGPANARPASKNLLEELRAEGVGVLAWAARGWREYRRLGGLCPPASVQAATRQYREAEDIEGRFLAECCDLDAEAVVMTADLKAAFEKWCEETGRTGPGRWRRMAKRLEEKFEKLKRRGNGVPWRGLTLKVVAEEN